MNFDIIIFFLCGKRVEDIQKKSRKLAKRSSIKIYIKSELDKKL